jgi:hypothetical protein
VPQKPDGNRPSDRITFTRGAAERISEVVRTVELGNRDGQPLRFQKVPCGSPGGGSVVRLAIYTATSSWLPISPFSTSQATTSHVRKIQFVFPTATVSQTSGPAGVPNGQTAMCVNNMAFLGAVTTVVTASITLITVMKEGGEWRLIGATR